MPTPYICGETLDDVLREVIEEVFKHGVPITPTKGRALELSGVLLEIVNPRARLSRTETRGKVFSALGELTWYLAGTNKVSFVSYYIKPYMQMADGDEIYGGYGPRLFNWDGINQIDNIIHRLRQNPHSRKAVAQLFDRTDMESHKNDIPCTCTLQFLIRDRKLHLITNMRSNDVHVGLPHDVFCFTMLQEIVARSIGVELGTYKHVVGSLHLYDRNSRAAKRFLDEGWQATNALMPSMPEGDPWVHIRTLLELESEIREAPAPIDLRYDNLPPYWADILRLLHMYRLRRDGDGQRITEVRDSLSSTLYRPFADRLLRQLATTGKFNLL